MVKKPSPDHTAPPVCRPAAGLVCATFAIPKLDGRKIPGAPGRSGCWQIFVGDVGSVLDGLASNLFWREKS